MNILNNIFCGKEKDFMHYKLNLEALYHIKNARVQKFFSKWFHCVAPNFRNIFEGRVERVSGKGSLYLLLEEWRPIYWSAGMCFLLSIQRVFVSTCVICPKILLVVHVRMM